MSISKSLGLISFGVSTLFLGHTITSLGNAGRGAEHYHESIYGYAVSLPLGVVAAALTYTKLEIASSIFKWGKENV